jgi:hypothetical protein
MALMRELICDAYHVSVTGIGKGGRGEGTDTAASAYSYRSTER